MSRLLKKCFFLSVGLHLLLVAVLILAMQLGSLPLGIQGQRHGVDAANNGMEFFKVIILMILTPYQVVHYNFLLLDI